MYVCLYILEMTSILDFPWFSSKSNVTCYFDSIFDLMCIIMMITDVYILMYTYILAGVDYFICDNASSTIFTVHFVVRQTNSTEVNICILDDNIFEDSEFFQLRILAVRFPPNLQPLFILSTGFDSVSAPIEIEDNDSELCI